MNLTRCTVAITLVLLSACDSKPPHDPPPPEEAQLDDEDPVRNPLSAGTAHHGSTAGFWHILYLPQPHNCSPAPWASGYRAPVTTPVPAAAARSVPGRAYFPGTASRTSSGPATTSRPATSARGGFGTTAPASSGG